MSALRIVEIVCDNCGDAERGTTITGLREDLRRVGWRTNIRNAVVSLNAWRKPPYDLCDKCSKKARPHA